MPYSKIIKTACILSSLVYITHSSAYQDYNMKLKGRLGYVHTDEKISTGSSGTVSQQKFKDDYLGEVAISYFFNSNFAIEFSAGAGSLEYVNNSGVGKDIFFIPVAAIAQIHFPINNTFEPYIGAGYSYSFIEREPSNTEIKNGGGIAFQAGVDLFASETMGLNLDIKYILDAKHDITIGTEKFKNDLSKTIGMIGVSIPF
ncbi:MAG: outer membrane beta-barrel protein [Alphaproteobacteria bacterium]|nr:outer membrane beta-barrel protein [Alphaproteobacteria bacterium]